MDEPQPRVLSDEDIDAYERILRLKKLEKDELERANIELRREVELAQAHIRANDNAIAEAECAIDMLLKSLGKSTESVETLINEEVSHEPQVIKGQKGDSNASALIRREAIRILKERPGERFSVKQILSNLPGKTQILATSKSPKSLIYQVLKSVSGLESELTGAGRLFYWPEQETGKRKEAK